MAPLFYLCYHRIMKEGIIMIYEIKVYQAKVQCPWTFMNYEFALKHGFNMNEYKNVGETNLVREEQDIYKILEVVFMEGNIGNFANEHCCRSISVSDIIEVNGIKYYVDDFGFKKIEL